MIQSKSLLVRAANALIRSRRLSNGLAQIWGRSSASAERPHKEDRLCELDH
jgi:hypothetical protein